MQQTEAARGERHTPNKAEKERSCRQKQPMEKDTHQARHRRRDPADRSSRVGQGDCLRKKTHVPAPCVSTSTSLL